MPNTNDASNSFYDELMNDASSLMKKEASYDEKSVEEALNNSDLNEEEISKLASAIEDMLDDENDNDIDIDGDTDGDTDGDIEGDNIEGDGSDDDDFDDDAESDEVDVEQLAAYYDDVQEKYASADAGVAQYVYDQLGQPDTEEAIHLATQIEDAAEKLAYINEISPYAVADDLLMTIASKLDDSDDSEE